MMAKRYPSVRAFAAFEPVPIGGGTSPDCMPIFATGPSPAPDGPWQTAQLIWYWSRPRATEPESAGTGLASAAIAVNAAGVGDRS
jgi:hypothetical protein